MKKNSILFFIMMLLSLPLFGQMHHPMMPANQKMESMIIYHLTEYLELTPEQAEMFFPMWRKHQIKMKGIYDEIAMLGEITTKNAKKDAYSERDFQATFDELQHLEKVILEEKKTFMEELKPVLTPSQRAKLLFFDEEFRRNLRKNLKNIKPKEEGRKE
ncbi:MAG: hypothetical protein PHE86_07425 [Candidatus Marinimicrobia bacterium]|nr:hypothetical protein [Candidatus Neomarinimicrobiota bacterium]MDD5583195.1 hypothetical protein [Candidatus Neomarinimicrobiota bacterium]